MASARERGISIWDVRTPKSTTELDHIAEDAFTAVATVRGNYEKVAIRRQSDIQFFWRQIFC
jgi:hypothetical protein